MLQPSILWYEVNVNEKIVTNMKISRIRTVYVTSDSEVSIFGIAGSKESRVGKTHVIRVLHLKINFSGNYSHRNISIILLFTWYIPFFKKYISKISINTTTCVFQSPYTSHLQLYFQRPNQNSSGTWKQEICE
jgi:hypothetical protein